MTERSNLFRSLRFKLLGTAIIVEVIMLSLLVWNSMRLMEQNLRGQMEHRVHELQPLLNASLAGPLLQEDLATMKEIMQQFNTEDVLFFAIYNTANEQMVTAGSARLTRKHGPPADPWSETNLLEDSIYLLRMPIRVIDQPVGRLELELSIDFITHAIATIRGQGLLIALAEVGLTVLLLSVLGLALTRHLQHLTRAAHSMADGDFSVRIPVTSRDEVGEAATTFNRMADFISSSQRQIRRLNNELEQRVQRRTTQLESTNQELTQIAETLQTERDEQQVLIGKLQDTQNQLLQSEKMASIGQLAAGVAHEINNPVGYINSNVGSLQQYLNDLFRVMESYERLEKEVQNETALSALQAIKDDVDLTFLKQDIVELISESLEGVTRVKQIVQDLKDFSHVDEAEWQWADLHKCIDSTLNVARNETKYKADVVKEYGDIPQVKCFPSQLNQVFLNLVVNAAHAIEERGVITVRSGCEGESVWVSISDTGKGISEEVQSRIFDPFFTTKPVGQGTGLGLSLSYGIVEKHKGHIELRSEVDKGTTFTVHLPIEPSSDSAVEVRDVG